MSWLKVIGQVIVVWSLASFVLLALYVALLRRLKR